MAHETDIRIAEQPSEIAACHAVMLQLRPQLGDADAFTQQVLRQCQHGYRLSAAWRDGQVVGAVGYRLQESLLYGRFVYVDDLVVDEKVRSGGLGAKLLSVARSYALESRCTHFVLDTGLHKALAQRFYFRQGMLTHSIGFIENLAAAANAK